MKRRTFLATLAATIASAHRGPAAAAAIRFGYAAITWGGKDLQAIEDIAAVGFEGIQLRSNVLESFRDRPAEMREILRKHRLTLVALSSGSVSIDPAVEQKMLDLHTSHAKWLRDAGGLYLQCTDQRPKRALTSEDYTRLGRLLTEIGKRTADLGIPLGYHNHMDAIGEKPEEVDRVLEAADPRYVKLELDVAHYHQGGGDPAKAIRQYGKRLLFLHIKDVESPVPGEEPASYRFVELGRGKVDLPGVFNALGDVEFTGWAVVELDRVPDPARTPKDSAIISKKFLEERIGLRIGT